MPPKGTKIANPKMTGTNGNKRGFIAGTNLPIKTAHKEFNGVFWLEERRKRVAKRYLEGWGQWEIAREENVDQATISADLDVVMRTWRDQANQSIDEHKRRELAKIDNLERMANEAFIRSVGIRKTVTKTSGSNGEYTKDELKVVRERLLGDPRWMDKIQWCIEQRCKIMGITKEEKNTQINNLMTINWDEIVTRVSDGDAINKAITDLEMLPSVEPVEEN